MNKAFFIVRDGLMAGALGTCSGPFESEAAALAVAAQLQPGSYKIWGNATVGKSFSIAAPVITIDK